MTGECTIEEMFAAKPGVLDIVFVHGLKGNAKSTWSAASTDEFWPLWISSRLAGISIYAVDYPAGIFAKWAKDEMNLHERAANLLEQLAILGIGQRPLAFICHSLGGIMAKEILRTSRDSTDPEWRLVSENVKLVAFLATPHTGAALATILTYVAPRVASTYIDQLSNRSGYLSALNQSYRNFADSTKFKTIAYYEKHKTKALVDVVSATSADPGVSGCHPVAIDADHIDICKPASDKTMLFTSLLRHLTKVLNSCPKPAAVVDSAASFEPDDYASLSLTDRRDLQQKLIDAGREKEFSVANDLQNRFAQQYYKHSLLADAKSRNDRLLSQVEQRFKTHVYTAKICRGATDDEIAAAIQESVINPLVTGPEAPSELVIYQALYFLTEQCYIRWDAK